jgi:hypothetical protein
LACIVGEGGAASCHKPVGAIGGLSALQLSARELISREMRFPNCASGQPMHRKYDCFQPLLTCILCLLAFCCAEIGAYAQRRTPDKTFTLLFPTGDPIALQQIGNFLKRRATTRYPIAYDLRIDMSRPVVTFSGPRAGELFKLLPVVAPHDKYDWSVPGEKSHSPHIYWSIVARGDKNWGAILGDPTFSKLVALARKEFNRKKRRPKRQPLRIRYCYRGLVSEKGIAERVLQCQIMFERDDWLKCFGFPNEPPAYYGHVWESGIW